uniref:RWD domain-containing protein n=1 Tax=Amblyomma maculatum TaxID=34609 RepID=G3MPC8_AMBMU
MESSNLNDNLNLQLAEVEMLSSMYPRSDEFKLLTAHAVSEFRDFLDGKCDVVFGSLDLNFRIRTEAGTVDLDVHLPHSYPSTPPEITLRVDCLDRASHTALTKEACEFLASQPPGSLIVNETVEWIRENFPRFCTAAVVKEITHDCRHVFTRLWIVSHHIYNKDKRRLILELGKEGKLTGFCLPGKPGIICFEGLSEECLSAWSTIRNLTWKRIGLKHQEDFELEDRQEVDSLRKFGKVAEIAFNTKQNASRDHHMDMGEFAKFLSEHGCADVFEVLFGIEAKINS